MKLYSEHTVWKDGGVNHWYVLNDNRTKMYAYRPFGQGPIVRLRTPLSFDDRGRKLQLEHDFGDLSGNTVRVSGSKGDVYTVDFSGSYPKCSCHAFKYRGGACKHIAIAEANRGK